MITVASRLPISTSIGEVSKYFPMTHTDTDPISNSNDQSYTFVANDGVYFDEVPTDFSSLFTYSDFNDPDIALWVTGSITDMHAMFYGCTNFNQVINLDTSNVTDMGGPTGILADRGGMFSGCTSFNQPVNFDTSNVTNMQYMFIKCSSFNQDISNWDVGAVTNSTNFSTDSALTCAHTPAGLPAADTNC